MSEAIGLGETPQDLRFFKLVLSSVADGVFSVDENRVITSFNRAAERITGLPSSQAVGRQCYQVFRSDMCEQCPLKKTMNTGEQSTELLVKIVNRDGETIPISISTSVLVDDDGEVLGAVETFRDLSAIETLRKQLNDKYSFEDIISKSPEIHKLFAMLPDIAESESTVLIQGPSGSGKELFARAIHNLSARSQGPYVVINCGTLPSQLFESEVFGYVRGAFTDAKRDKKGKLDAARKGTVFFDEIGELPLSTQVKLLRVLQQREYEPLGSASPTKADIRVVAATNKDLKELVARGRFRDDLYFRLAVVRFDLPPLKARREDIPYLVDHFVKRFNALRDKRIIGVSPEVMRVLMDYDFPGNIRELENIIEHGFVLCHGNVIQLDHLPSELNEPQFQSRSLATPVARAITEKERLEAALERHRGRIGAAADELGIHRTTLWRRLKRYGIAPDSFKSKSSSVT